MVTISNGISMHHVAETDSLEADVKKALKKFLLEQGAWYTMPVPMGYGQKTIDFFVCHQGVFIGIETKRPRIQEATKLQDKTMADIRKAGGVTILENSKGLETTRAVFRKIRDAIISDGSPVALNGFHFRRDEGGKLRGRSADNP